MRMRLWSSMAVMALLFGIASGVSAKKPDKSWEIDIYGDDVDVTYVPDGRDDVHVYDHNNPYNDRSYIEVDPPRHHYRDRYVDHRRYDQRYDRRYDQRYDYYDNRRAYVPRHYRPRYRVEYHNRYRGW